MVQKQKIKIREKKCLIVTNDIGFDINPSRLDITKEKLLEYISSHPMPEDPEYNLDSLILDLVNDTKDIYELPYNLKEETKMYIIKLIEELRNDRPYDIWKL